jgi:fucose 4-O-acetylase-like acetyltransferase
MNKAMPTNSRAGYLDIAKGILISLVVFGHAWRAVYSNGILTNEGWFQNVDGWIYSFHMPAFFFLAGVFALKSAERPLLQFVMRKMQTVAVLQVVMAGSTTHLVSVVDLLRIPLYPVMQFWFLYALFFVFLLFGVLARMTHARLFFLAVGVLLFVLFQLDYLSSLPVLVYLGMNFIFFGAGVFCSIYVVDKDCFLLSQVMMPIAPILAATASFVVLYPGRDLWPSSSWLNPVCAMPGIYFVLIVARILALRQGRVNEFFAFIGSKSLEIFVAHTIFSAGFRIVCIRFFGERDLIVHVAGAVFAGIVGPLLLAHGCERLGFRYLFTWPRHSIGGPSLEGSRLRNRNSNGLSCRP